MNMEDQNIEAGIDLVRATLLQRALQRINDAYERVFVGLAEYAPPVPADLRAEMARVVSKLKKASSIADRLDAITARELADITLWAERIRKGRELLEAAKAEHGDLWPDAPRLAWTLDQEMICDVIRERVQAHSTQRLAQRCVDD